ncbi:hypothetical protein PRIPAC_83719 [Pristionchus pacificus]|uniref:Uncharacterized protein n=1 Tax=Pristionchus pacificus TaxID=54126 RepID=A0A2A6BNN7_PRIPA|nr:hypothetical protein PRIPAC_83719 [Pristionchus pacificus]|eukprot:PDM67527.1 hypothetical protein PRIPAC_48944 [Pristionchus pacificus]
MNLLLLFLTFFMQTVDSCARTSSIAVPAPLPPIIPPTCGVGCDPFIFISAYDLTSVPSTNAMGCDVLTLTCTGLPVFMVATITVCSQ